MVTRTVREGPNDWRRRPPDGGQPDASRKADGTSEEELVELSAYLSGLIRNLVDLQLRHSERLKAAHEFQVEARRADLLRQDLILSHMSHIESWLAASGCGPSSVESLDTERPDLAALMEGIARITLHLERVEERSAALEAVINEVADLSRETQARLDRAAESTESGPDSQQGVFDAVEQTREVMVAVARKLDDLSQRAIDRQVDPVYCALAKVHGELGRVAVSANGALNSELTVVNDEIARFLDSRDLRLIEPRPGDPSSPLEHEIIKQEVSGNGHPDGAVARLYWPGLARDKRVIRRAQVSIYRVNETPNQLKEKSDGTDHPQ